MKTLQVISTFVLILFFAATDMNAQWTNSGNNITTTDNVGIGTTNPQKELHLYKNTTNNIGVRLQNSTQVMDIYSGATVSGLWVRDGALQFGSGSSERMRIAANGNVGIGTNAPNAALDVRGQIHSSGSLELSYNGTGDRNSYIDFHAGENRKDHDFRIWRQAGENNHVIFRNRGTGSTVFQNEGNNQMVIHANGQVGLGVWNVPNGYKMGIGGKLICEELKVQLHGQWADYVFLPNYNLLPLDDVEAYIKEKGHLHNTPSAAELEADGGIEISKMTINQQEKIEELYLHIIEINKTLKATNNRLETLEVENARLKVQRAR